MPEVVRKILLSIARFAIYSNFFVALGAYAMSSFFIRYIFEKAAWGQRLPLFIGFATLFTYNFHRRIGMEVYGADEVSASLSWMKTHPLLSRSITLISFALSLYFFMDLPKTTYFLIAPISLVSLMYVLKISEQMPLRQVPFLKLFLIATAWSVTTVLIPALGLDLTLNRAVIACFFALLSYMVAEIIPFDIRDMQSDQRIALKTIPNVWGIPFSLRFAFGCLLISQFCILLAIDWDFSNLAFLSWMAASTYLLIYLVRCRKPRSDLFYSFFVEFSLLMPFLLAESLARLGLT